MKAIQTALGLLLAVAATAQAASSSEFDTELDQFAGDGRFLVTNFTSGLVAVNSTLLAYALIAIAIAGAVAVALYFLFVESQNNSSSHAYGNSAAYGNYGNYQYARSSKDGYDFNGMNVIQWISMLQELYDKFDFNDLDCQKRLICEVMKEPEYYGTLARKFKNGFEYAKYLELLSLPDEMRELLDEYLDANSRSEQQKDCSEFFQCDYSIKDSVKKSISGNDL